MGAEQSLQCISFGDGTPKSADVPHSSSFAGSARVCMDRACASNPRAMACTCAGEDVVQSSTFVDEWRDTKSGLHFAYSQTLLSAEATDKALYDAVLLTSG